MLRVLSLCLPVTHLLERLGVHATTTAVSARCARGARRVTSRLIAGVYTAYLLLSWGHEMHAKKRNNWLMLYRSGYVRKGVEGNTHGYPEQKYVGSLPNDALEIPRHLVDKLLPAEVEYVTQKVIVPARRRAEEARQVEEQERRDADNRERDPRWRLEEALRLLMDAGKLVLEAGRGIDAGTVDALSTALEQLAVAGNIQRDPLDGVFAAVVCAASAVRAGHYGKAPASKLSDTSVYRKWRSIAAAVDDGEDSLLRALQATGWARARG